MRPINLKFPTSGITFKPVVAKPKHIVNSHKPITKILYCLAKETEEGWKAYVNTRGLEGYEDLTILDFTDRSFETQGVNNVFRKEKGKTILVIRNDNDAIYHPGSRAIYCTLCNNYVFSGHIVKLEGKLMFDMSVYKGRVKDYETLLTQTNKNKDENE